MTIFVNIGLWVWPSVHCSKVDLYYCWRVGHKNVSAIRNSEVSVVQGLLYYWNLWSYNPDLGKRPL